MKSSLVGHIADTVPPSRICRVRRSVTGGNSERPSSRSCTPILELPPHGRYHVCQVISHSTSRQVLFVYTTSSPSFLGCLDSRKVRSMASISSIGPVRRFPAITTGNGERGSTRGQAWIIEKPSSKNEQCIRVSRRRTSSQPLLLSPMFLKPFNS